MGRSMMSDWMPARKQRQDLSAYEEYKEIIPTEAELAEEAENLQN